MAEDETFSTLIARHAHFTNGKTEDRRTGALPAGTANAGVRSQGSWGLYFGGWNLCEAGNQGAEKEGKEVSAGSPAQHCHIFLSWYYREATSNVYTRCGLWVLMVQAILT